MPTSNLTPAYQQYLADPSSANELLAEVTQYALKLCRKRGLSDADAADASQEASLKLWRSLGRFDPAKSSFRTFTHRLTLAAIADLRRRASDDQQWEGEGHDTLVPTPRTSFSAIRSVRAAAGDKIELIDLILIYGSIAEAAQRLHITERAARNRLRRLGSKINIQAA